MQDFFDFLRQLAANNNREWFKAQKPHYDLLRAQWLDNLDRLGALLAADNPTLAGQRGRDAAYRIYRDTRFREDKTPYKTFLSAAFTQGGRSAMRAGLYLHISPLQPADTGLYGGIWMPPSPLLKKLRHAIVDNIEEWEEIMNEPRIRRNYSVTCTERLKTAPQGWPKDHPQLQWLQMKDYGLWHQIPLDTFLRPDWTEEVAALARPLLPFIHFLNYSIDE